MASLNTLRTKYGIVLSIVIALVLVAFILGDQLSMSGRQEAADEVELVINGEEIRSKEYSEAYQQVGNEQDVESYLIYEHFFAPEFESLGLTSLDEVTMKSVIAQAMADEGATKEAVVAQLNSYSPAELRLVYAQVISAKAISEGAYYNIADLEQFEAQNKNKYSGRYVKYPYSDIADADVTVTEEEIKAYYDAHPLTNTEFGARELIYVEFEHPANEDGTVDADAMRQVAMDVDAFVAEAKGDVESFEAAANELGMVPETLAATMAQLSYMQQMAQMTGNVSAISLLGSSDIAQWAYTTNVNAINKFTVGNKTIVAMVKSVDNDKYCTYASIEDDIRTKLMNDKKYEIIAQQITFDAAKAEKFEDVMFNNSELDKHFVGAICTSSQADVDAKTEIVVKGKEDAYIFVVEKIENNVVDAAAERVSYTEKNSGGIRNAAMRSYLSNLEVENPRQK